MINLLDRINNLFLNEETYDVTVKKKGIVPREQVNISDVKNIEHLRVIARDSEAQKVAALVTPVISKIKNVSVEKSFNLKDLARHRFVVSTKMDAHVLQDYLKTQLKTIDVDVKPSSEKSLAEGIIIDGKLLES